ncbi:putative dehydrogenase [Paenarthrobacter nicotinovorans]|uniref:Gfo/Idh/MocA family protein n=1 Tax=Micrococcaceae TaxID=1268 RepID=UPI000876AE5A|nr:MULTISPECIES: Gfo/Idh/MocA family oxidoreductase [Micrococcaceae]MDR6437990.1 putative dehydrogenase [Paenarthrobacter nicotinovorans]SCZ62501.1 Predicted dehydrogenase [Arthrobacter sp. UNCCL28]
MTLSNGTSDGTIRWGILGTGFIAGLQAKDLKENGFTVQAVGSRSLESSGSFAGEYGAATAHGSYEDLVADPMVDVVYVATPHPFHHANALLALNAGKHVLVEKSFTMNAREAQEIVDLAGSKGLVVLEAMWTRFLPHMIRLREIIAAGTIGEVRKVVATHNQSLPKDPAHRLNDPALGGGALLDLGIYPISFAFDILGTPASIKASASLSATGVDRQTAAVFEYPNGGQAIVDCELDAASANRAMVIGTDGWIDIEHTWYNPVPFTVFAVDGTVVERYEQPVSSRGMQYQAAELERLIRAGSTAGTILPPGETVAIMAAMDEIRQQIGLRYAADSEEADSKEAGSEGGPQ